MTGPGTIQSAHDGADGQRIDKWLWFTRLVKTRGLAQTLVLKGKVRVNRERISKTSHIVHPGDVVTAMVHRKIRVLKVLAAGTRRGPADEAAQLYSEIGEPDGDLSDRHAKVTA